MTRHSLIALLLAATALAQEPFDKAAEEAYERQVTATREKGLYKKIAWKANAAEARKAAEVAGRPILVFIVVGEMAKKNAPDC